MGIEVLLEGKEVSTPCYGSFYQINRTLQEMQAGKLGAYLHQHREHLTQAHLSKAFPALTGIDLTKVMFFDIENCGFEMGRPIFLMTYGHFPAKQDPNLHITSLFARDFSEERPAIAYFLEQLHASKAYISYNGKSFDLDRTGKRAQAHGIMVNGYRYRRLNDVLNSTHIDLVHIPHFKGGLQTNEKLKFGYARKNDVAGADLPQIYGKYVHREGNQEEVEQQLVGGIRHNREDIVSLAALTAYACVNPGKIMRR